MKGSNRMVPFLDLWTDVLTMLVSWARQTGGRKSGRSKEEEVTWDGRADGTLSLRGHDGMRQEAVAGEEAGQATPYNGSA